MNIYVSYSHKDRDIVAKIVAKLKEDGHALWIDSDKLAPGDLFKEKMEEGLRQADVLIVIISQNSFHSEWVKHEYSAIALQQISTKQQKIIPVKIDEISVPSYLANRHYLNLSVDFDTGLDQLREVLRNNSINTPCPVIEDKKVAHELRDTQVRKVHDSLRTGQLVLVCGAGISVGAGIPAWGNLLSELLELMMERVSKEHSLKIDKTAAAEFQKSYGGSSLILGKYLKNYLRQDFPSKVREVLYKGNPSSSLLIDSIVELCCPQRDIRALDSIITFNFDCLIEEGLAKNRIANKPIYSESVKHNLHQLPIYHVHGFLPRTGDIPDDSELVFSEDAYHSQFIEPFSWSNLTQLNKLTQNTCLFVGISLTDPNMRRLLDVAWRKNSEKSAGHYMIKRRPCSDDTTLNKIYTLLEESDANTLGLDVIWIDSFDELPTLLQNIASPI